LASRERERPEVCTPPVAHAPGSPCAMIALRSLTLHQFRRLCSCIGDNAIMLFWRRILAVHIILLAVLLLASTFSLLRRTSVDRTPFSPGVTLENYQRMHRNTPAAEVSKLFGCKGRFDPEMPGYAIWDGPECKVRIRFYTAAHAGSYFYADDPTPYLYTGELVTDEGKVYTIP
jgi:hypothetical protein